jgi:hypothetical protein
MKNDEFLKRSGFFLPLLFFAAHISQNFTTRILLPACFKLVLRQPK